MQIGYKMEEYLTTTELSDRIKMAPGTIRNLVWRGVLLENIHFVRPTPRKILFVWNRIEAWIHGKEKEEMSDIRSKKDNRTNSLINI